MAHHSTERGQPDNVISGTVVILLLLGMLLFAAAGCAVVDKPPVLVQVRLVNEDIISGRLKHMVDKKLQMKNKYAGDLTVDWKGVIGIITANKSLIELRSGDILNGRFVKASDGKARITTDAANSSEISIYDVMSIDAPPIQWEGKLTLKYSRVRGNTITDDFGVRLRTSKESRKYRIFLKGSYDYGESGGELLVKKGDVKLKYSHKISKRWYGFGAGSAEYDRIAKLNMRSTAGAGIGMKAIDNPDGSLRFEVGAQYTNEDFENLVPDLDDRFSEGTFTAEYERKFTKDLKLYSLLEFAMPFKTYDNWRLHSETCMTYKLSKMIALEIGFIIDSDQGPPPGVERNDKEVYAGLAVEF
ncbi:MAG: DUF481 domain-containing protein [Planctomycetota bacterium]|nr:MAG: DUF481 domain-containing protein [Planctomycetota bacterium]